MDITKVRAVILHLGENSIPGTVKREVGPLMIIESRGYYLTDLSDPQHKVGQDIVRQQLKDSVENSGNFILGMPWVVRERG